MTETAIINMPGNEFSLSRFMPRDLTELVKFAGYAAGSGVFGAMSNTQALIIMLQGAELGINPLQALREIPLVNGKPRPSATLVAGLIQRSRECEAWSMNSSPQSVTLHAKRRGRDAAVVTVKIEDVPASLTSKQVWKDNPEDMLVARAIHRMARRHFADLLAGIQDPDEIDETRVIDVAKVEHVTGITAMKCPNCGGNAYLHANKTGGAFMRCDSCAETFSPPQEARDAMRGTPEHLTLAGAVEPVLEPGERAITQEDLDELHPTSPLIEGVEPESAVQSEYEGATLDGEDVVAPAAAEAVIPELDPRAANQAMRDAAYQHWLRPRPAAFKIAMRGILEDFGWDGGLALGDWLLTLPDDKLAAVCDALAGVS
jgi:hypothetical protein